MSSDVNHYLNSICNLIGSRIFRDLTFGEGLGPIFLDRVTCSSEQLTLLECDSSPIGVHTCSHSQDVGIQCIGIKLI